MKVWAFIDWYESNRLRLFKSKKDVYRYTEQVYHDLYGTEVKLTNKNQKEISDYVGFSIKQIKVE